MFDLVVSLLSKGLLALLFIYIAIRIGTVAYYRSKKDEMFRTRKEK